MRKAGSDGERSCGSACGGKSSGEMVCPCALREQRTASNLSSVFASQQDAPAYENKPGMFTLYCLSHFLHNFLKIIWCLEGIFATIIHFHPIA